MVQLDLTPEIEVFHMLFERSTKDRKISIKLHVKYFNFRSLVQLDHPVRLLRLEGGCDFSRILCKIFPYIAYILILHRLRVSRRGRIVVGGDDDVSPGAAFLVPIVKVGVIAVAGLLLLLPPASKVLLMSPCAK